MSIYPLPPPAHQIDAAKGVPLRRPFGLKAIIALLILQILVSVILILGFFVNSQAMLESISSDPELFAQLPITIIMAVLLLVPRLLAAIGLWRLRRWGWVLNMVLISYAMAYDAVLYFRGTPHYFPMLVNVLMVFYLNQQDVQSLFEQTDAVEAP
jgi:uncharacterized membrane protein (DUF2068 family)